MRAEGTSKAPEQPEAVKKPMNTASEAFRKLLIAHFSGDDVAFRSAAQDFVENERRLNHHTLANELAHILSEANGSAASAEECPRFVDERSRKPAEGQGKKCSPRRARRATA